MTVNYEEMTASEVKSLPRGEFLDALVYYKEKYYAGNPVISDAQYDELERFFCSQYPDLIDQLPVGTTLDEFDKVEHEVPMGSLGKLNSEGGVKNWISQQTNVVFQPKLDGCAVELVYEDGKLEYMLTRGDGIEGEDVTHVARVLKHVPSYIDVPEFKGTTIIRGEAVLHKEGHENEARRNLATGSLKSLDPKVAIERDLKVYVHTIVDINAPDYEYEEIFNFLDVLGFLVCPIFDSFEDPEKPWFNVPYDVDGVVIKSVSGATERNAISYKFPDESLYTEVTGVSYQLGRTGKITPVLQVKPVHKDGRKLQNVSLGSYEILQTANLGIGDTVEVTFANDIIPHLESVVERTNSERFSCDECPESGGEVEMDGSHLYSQNKESFEFKKKRFSAMLGGISVDGLGGSKKKDLGELYNYDFPKLIRTFDRSDSVPRELYDIEGWGSKTSEKIWNQVVDSMMNLTWEGFYKILSLDAFGTKTRQKYLCANKDNPFPLTEKKLLNTPGVQKATAQKIIESYKNSQDAVDVLIEVAGTNLELGVLTEEDTGNKLNGVKVFVTGSLENFSNRGELKEFIRSYGGKFGKSKESILITNTNNSSSSKAKYARNNDLPIMTESEFLEEYDLLQN